jgi:hypothetical protein
MTAEKLRILGAWVAMAGILAAVVAFALGIRAANARRQAQAKEEARRQEEEAAASILRSARRVWTPGEGVAEAASGPLLSWIAVQPVVALDWKLERTAEHPRREIPVRWVVLNNSFAEVPLTTRAGGSWWHVRVTARGSGATLAEWRQDESEDASLAPAQRREWRLLWDGRNGRNGKLAAPGEYSVQSEVKGPWGVLEARVHFTLKDDGEVVTARVRVPATQAWSPPLTDSIHWDQLAMQRCQERFIRQTMALPH